MSVSRMIKNRDAPTCAYREQWRRLQAILPKQKAGPETLRGDRLFIEAVLCRAKTGMPWRDLPERFGPVEVGLQPVLQTGRSRAHWASIRGAKPVLRMRCVMAQGAYPRCEARVENAVRHGARCWPCRSTRRYDGAYSFAGGVRGGGMVRGPYSRVSSLSRRRARVSRQYLGASSM